MSLTEVYGCCPVDCQDGCSWVAHVEDRVVTKVTGRKDHPFTRGVLCAKVKDYEAKTYAPDRLLYPLRRTGPKGSGAFERISWDEAIGEIATRFRSIIDEHGAEAIMPLHDMGSAGVLQRRAMMRLFHSIGASRLHGSLCGQAGNAIAGDGHPLGFDPETVANSQLVLLWGSNLLSTAHHHWHFCAEARKANDAKIITIDPRRTRTAQKSDEHLQIRTGTDAVLAAGIANILVRENLADLDYARSAAIDLDDYLEEIAPWSPQEVAAHTGIPEAEIIRVAHLFGAAKPGTIRCGIGPQQTIDGEIFLRHISALAILAGHWRYPGGGLLIEAYPTLDNSAAERPDLSPQGTRSLDRARLGETLTSKDLDPPVRALMVWGHNPIVNQIDAETVRAGLCREDLFTVVVEHFLTDSARHADIVLPSTTQLEHFDIQGSWGQQYIGLNTPAIEPLGETKPHTEILRLLASRMELDEAALYEDDETIARSSLPEDFDWNGLKTTGWVKAPQPRRDPAAGGPLLKLRTGLPKPGSSEIQDTTSDGRLRLLTAKAHYFINSTFANMPRQLEQQGVPTLEMHPADADRLDLADGDEVVATNDHGSVAAVLKVTDAIAEGTTVFEGKWWWGDNKEFAPVTNRLADSNWTEGGQPTFNDIFVAVQKAG